MYLYFFPFTFFLILSTGFWLSAFFSASVLCPFFSAFNFESQLAPYLLAFFDFKIYNIIFYFIFRCGERKKGIVTLAHINRRQNGMHGNMHEVDAIAVGHTILIELNRFMNETTDTKANEKRTKQHRTKTEMFESFKAWHMIKQIKDTRKPNSKWHEIKTKQKREKKPAFLLQLYTVFVSVASVFSRTPKCSFQIDFQQIVFL